MWLVSISRKDGDIKYIFRRILICDVDLLVQWVLSFALCYMYKVFILKQKNMEIKIG